MNATADCQREADGFCRLHGWECDAHAAHLAEQDRLERCRPDTATIERARALLADYPADQDLSVVVPMVFPGKHPGIWRRGQEVVTVPGVLILARHGDAADPAVISYALARATASELARSTMVSRYGCGTGSYGYASIDRTGLASVTED